MYRRRGFELFGSPLLIELRRRSAVDSKPVPLLVFAKPPRAGVAKTRLGARLGPEGAAVLARAFFDDTWATVSALGWATPILVTTEPAAPEWRSAGIRPGMRPSIRSKWAQGEGDLGARLESAFRRALASSPAAVAIGTDSPGLPAGLLDAARTALAESDAVLGPTTDGGFYLIGLRRCPEGLLAGLPWSSDETLDRTRERLLERGLRVEVLPTWFDVDRPEDLAPLKRRLWRGDFEARATARALAGLVCDTPRISVVVPALNEERRIEPALCALVDGGGWHEVILVDGASSDRTSERALAVPGVRVLQSPRGRARQMNTGARAASGDVLLFLHADVVLPPDAPARIAAALEDPTVVAGAFRTWTVADDPDERDERRSWLAPLLHLGDLRSRYSGLPYGDQALFVRAGVFERLGGYPDQPLMEDLELARRLRRSGRVSIVPARVRVSGRRFLARPLYYFALVNLLPLFYALGVPAHRLARLYGDPR